MIQNDIDELRRNFGAMYIGAIPQLHFELLSHDAALQVAFLKRLNDNEAGGVQSFVVEQIEVSGGAA